MDGGEGWVGGWVGGWVTKVVFIHFEGATAGNMMV